MRITELGRPGLGALVLALAVSCQGRGGGSSAQSLSVSGSWGGRLSSDSGQNDSLLVTGIEDDSGELIGEALLSSACFGGGALVGRRGGGSVSMALRQGSETLQIFASSAGATRLSGSFSVQGGACDGERGTLDLRRYPEGWGGAWADDSGSGNGNLTAILDPDYVAGTVRGYVVVDESPPRLGEVSGTIDRVGNLDWTANFASSGSLTFQGRLGPLRNVLSGKYVEQGSARNGASGTWTMTLRSSSGGVRGADAWRLTSSTAIHLPSQRTYRLANPMSNWLGNNLSNGSIPERSPLARAGDFAMVDPIVHPNMRAATFRRGWVDWIRLRGSGPGRTVIRSRGGADGFYCERYHGLQDRKSVV